MDRKSHTPRAHKRGEPRLTRDLIVAEAIDLLNREGLDGVSLRKLAARLNIKAPSLYWHFADKATLLSAMLEKIFDRCLDSVPSETQWQQWMRLFGKALWQAQHDVRDFGRLITTSEISEEQMARTMQRVRQAVSALDLEELDAMRLQSSIQAMTVGWSAFASAPYAGVLGKTIDFNKEAMNDLELLIAGQALKLEAERRPDRVATTGKRRM